MVFWVDYIDHCTEQRIGCHFEVCSSSSRDSITWPDHMLYSRFDSFLVIQQNLEYENHFYLGITTVFGLTVYPARCSLPVLGWVEVKTQEISFRDQELIRSLTI